jgi:methionyl-tRNA formyltransferase
MRLAILTTRTIHHTHFVKEISKFVRPHLVVVETASIEPPFATHHTFEDKRDKYEENLWFCGREASLEEFAHVVETPSVNDAGCLELLQNDHPDLIVDFGTGKVNRELIDSFSDRIVNLHGGDPERYRGLDTHLWSIYHRDVTGLMTTLHRLSPSLDCGEIVEQASIPIPRSAKIHELRRFNTDICIELTLRAIDTISRKGRLFSRPQQRHGRYYSFMPSVLKDLCLNRFDRLAQKHGE